MRRRVEADLEKPSAEVIRPCYKGSKEKTSLARMAERLLPEIDRKLVKQTVRP